MELRKCTESDREHILSYIANEPEVNVYIYGNIENYGVDTEEISIFVNEKDGSWDSLVLKYYHQFLLYSQKEEIEVTPVVELLSQFEVDGIQGKEALVRALVPYYPVFSFQKSFFCKCTHLVGPQARIRKGVTIRKLEKEEVPHIISFYRNIDEFREFYVGDQEELAKVETSALEHGAERYGVFVGEELVTIVGVGSKNQRSAIINGVATQAKYRRKGYARIAVRKVCKDCFAEGKEFVCLFYANQDAGQLYRNIGFEEIGKYAILQKKSEYKKKMEQLPYHFRRLKPMDSYEGFQIRPGLFGENGARVVPGGVNFTIYSRHATSCELLLFFRKEKEPFAIIPFPKTYRIGYVYSMIVFDLDVAQFEYAYRFDGPYDKSRGLIFDKNKILLDPYARAVTGQSRWGIKPPEGSVYHARVVVDEFEWDDSKQPEIPMEELVIYELHVRGFTRHESSEVACPGTFAGVMEKIPYLKQLGINAVELMPIFEFDEVRDVRYYEGKQLLDYWGYNPVSFFAPNTSYTSSLEYNHEGNELKNLIRELNRNGIEVILDVVFNHTAEGNEDGPYISYKGIDNNVYYMLTPDGSYYNFSGCGNTLNCNHPVVQRMILDCLRYWVTEYRVDGFRFDLASILGRNEDGAPMNNPPLLQALAYDPILGKVKLIAEAWDAGGMYQVGSFPSWQRWSEWNGKYRDDMRRFLKGDQGYEQIAASRMLGSLDMYDPKIRGDAASVNFITCHDGFTLWDLYSYNEKHNEGNGWNNSDGENNNNSWNCGIEGETQNEEVLTLRKKLVKNACVTLLSSRGIPMILAGDEFGNTQFGNNNAYCQDNDISWLDWGLLHTSHDLFKFYKFMIAFRKTHPVIYKDTPHASLGMPCSSIHGLRPWNWQKDRDHHYIGILYAGQRNKGKDDYIYIAVNTYWEERTIVLPTLGDNDFWTLCVDTERNIVNAMELVENEIRISPRTVQIYIAHKKQRKEE